MKRTDGTITAFERGDVDSEYVARIVDKTAYVQEAVTVLSRKQSLD